MSPEQAYGLAQFLIAQAENESAVTRRVLAAVPNDKGDYKPAEKCMTAAKLAGHIAQADVWFLESIAAGAFGAEQGPELTPAEAVAFYDQNFDKALAKVKALSGEQLAQTVDFYGMKMPAVTYLQFMIVHTVHHRGQLSAYLRPMGAKVPSIYGGSADEPFEAAAAQG